MKGPASSLLLTTVIVALGLGSGVSLAAINCTVGQAYRNPSGSQRLVCRPLVC